jgi:hypothetical protein
VGRLPLPRRLLRVRFGSEGGGSSGGARTSMPWRATNFGNPRLIAQAQCPPVIPPPRLRDCSA